MVMGPDDIGRVMKTGTGEGKGKGKDETDRLYRRMVKSVVDSIVCMLDRSGHLLSWNQGGCALTGYTAEEIVGSSFRKLLDKTDLSKGRYDHIAAAVENQGFARGEAWCIRKDGSQFWSDFAFSRIDDDDGAYFGVSVVIRDLTERKEREDAQRASDVRFRATMDNSPVGLALVSIEGRWLEVNRALSDLLGYTHDELAMLTFHQITHADDLETDLHLVNELLSGARSSYRMEKRYICKDGSLVWGLLAVSLIRDANGEPDYFISQIQDMTDVREIQRELEHEALHDPLTGLPNRRKFQIGLTDALENARRHGTEHCLCFIDLDGFKDVNDSAGHDVGDMLLNAISRELEKSVRAGDLVARFGGDEFSVILYDCPIAVGQTILNRLCGRIAEMSFDCDGTDHRVTASIGIAAITPDTNSAGEALRRADMACYDAKRGGRNTVRVHCSSTKAKIVRLAC